MTDTHSSRIMRSQQEPSIISAVANIFDKHVFHWLRMTWDQFEQTKVL